MSEDKKQTLPPQSQNQQPGLESEMRPAPDFTPRFKGSERLKGKVALISGGDSGIGRAVAIGMAREGALVMILYLNEHDDAQKTIELVKAEGSRAEALAGDIGTETFCKKAIDRTLSVFG